LTTPFPLLAKEGIKGRFPLLIENLLNSQSILDIINQHRFFFWYKKENRNWIRKRLAEAKRPDLAKRLLCSDKKESHQQTKHGNKTMPKSHGGHRRVRNKS
jgi:hypothetical protein